MRTAAQLRDQGVQAVLDFAGEPWTEVAIAVCHRYFRFYPGDHLFEEAKQYAIRCGVFAPSSPNAWGAVCLTMARRNIIVKTGQYANSTGLHSHGRANPLWRLV